MMHCISNQSIMQFKKNLSYIGIQMYVKFNLHNCILTIKSNLYASYHQVSYSSSKYIRKVILVFMRQALYLNVAVMIFVYIM